MYKVFEGFLRIPKMYKFIKGIVKVCERSAVGER